MTLNPVARVRILSGEQYTMRLRSLHRAYPSLHPSGVVHWVPEQLNIKVVTGACKLIDACCSLALCSTTVSVASADICHRNKVNSIAWLYRKAQPKDSIIYITLHYLLTHYIFVWLSWFLHSCLGLASYWHMWKCCVTYLLTIYSYEMMTFKPCHNRTRRRPTRPSSSFRCESRWRHPSRLYASNEPQQILLRRIRRQISIMIQYWNDKIDICHHASK